MNDNDAEMEDTEIIWEFPSSTELHIYNYVLNQILNLFAKEVDFLKIQDITLEANSCGFYSRILGDVVWFQGSAFMKRLVEPAFKVSLWEGLWQRDGSGENNKKIYRSHTPVKV